VPKGLWEYSIAINGVEFDPRDLLHFTLNPGAIYPWLGEGFTLSLQDVAQNLRDATRTTRGFMRSEYKPNLIVKVDAIDGMDTPEGRKKILNEFVLNTEAGQPWVVPAEQIDVKEVRPLTLSDLALADFVKLDKQTVAAILGVPPFVLGVGEFKRDWWNSFVSSEIMTRAQPIQQVLTRGLVPEPNRFFRFNPRTLLNYSMEELIKAGSEMVDRMAMRRNEWRDWMGLEPDEEMDELLALENYIPADRLGDQKKLTGGESK
jgi:HK97 family phage portal protein